MHLTTLVRKNLTRNPLRMGLTIGAIALPMFLFTVAAALVDGVDTLMATADRNLRVAVHQKLTFTTALPDRIRGEIEQLAPEGYLDAVCRMAWFGGRVEGVPSYFPSAGVDKDTFHLAYHQFKLSPEEVARFQDNRQGAVIGAPLAQSMNWKVGDKVTLKSGIPPFVSMEFQIVAVPPEMDQPWFYFGYDYLDETYRAETGESRGVNNFWIKCRDGQARKWALKEVDRHFANTAHQTKTEMESTFIQGFIQGQGDFVGMVWTVGRMIVFVAVAVAFNSLSMAFRERTREYGVMRALGFSSSTIRGVVLSEGLILGAVGGFLAVVPIYLLTVRAPIQVPQMGAFEISSRTAAIAFGVSLLCGVLAAAWPAYVSGRLKVAGILRKVV